MKQLRNLRTALTAMAVLMMLPGFASAAPITINWTDGTNSGTITVSASLSVGYVVWLIRGGLLASTVLASLPAWQFLDPLPVLARIQGPDEDDDSEEESLDSIIKQREETADTEKKARNSEAAMSASE